MKNPFKRVHIEDIAAPQTDEEAAAMAAWIQATPEQRLNILVEVVKFGKLLTGQIWPEDLEKK